MPDAKISADPLVSSPADADSLPVVSGGVNKRMSFSGLKAYLQSGLTLFSGAYADLTGKPSLFSGAYADLTGKPSLFSGSYADLTGKPSLGTAAAQNTGTAVGNVVVVQTGGKIDPSLYTAGGGGGSGPQNNYAATVAPTATDDANAGYSVGSSWLIPATGEMWRCRVATAGAARWVKVDTADHPGYVAGRYYLPFGVGTSAAGAALSATATYLFFGVIKQRITLSQLGARVNTASSGGQFQMAIYEHDTAAVGPKKLVAATVSASSATAGMVNAAFSGGNVTVEPGNYWFALQSDNGTAVFTSQAPANSFHSTAVGSPTGVVIASASAVVSYNISGTTFGTWPADFTSGFTFSEQSSIRSPLIQFQVASVP